MSQTELDRIEVINHELVRLSPIRIEQTTALKETETSIERLCAEKDRIYRTYVEVKVITTKQVREKHIKESDLDPTRMIARLSDTAAAQVLAQVRAMLAKAEKELETNDDMEEEE
jgi:hypothetical protein